MLLSRSTLALTGLRSSGEAGFSPLSVSGLEFWVDFSKRSTLFKDTSATIPVTTDGDSIAYVADRSGNARHPISATANQQPMYKVGIQNGLSVARLLGSGGDRLRFTGSFTLAQPLWLFGAAKSTLVDGSGSQPLIVDSGSEGLILQDAGSTNRWRMTFGTALQAASDEDANWHVISGKGNGASSLIRRDGVQIASGNANTGAFNNNITIGANQTPTIFFTGDIGELLIYRADLSDADRDAVELYLMEKWT